MAEEDAKRNGYTALADATEAPKANVAVVWGFVGVPCVKSGCGYGLSMLIGQCDGNDGTALLAAQAVPALQGKPADSKEPVQIEKVHDRIQACHTGPDTPVGRCGAMFLVI